MKVVSLFVIVCFVLSGCDTPIQQQTSDQKQTAQQNQILNEATNSVGMPNIKNFRERRIMKDILELRDQEGLVTYTYTEVVNPHIIPGKTAKGGTLMYQGESVGYPIPYATQYTSPMRPGTTGETDMLGNVALPQADPNGLFSPVSAEATWVLLKDPKGSKTLPVYYEPRLVCSPFQFPFDE